MKKVISLLLALVMVMGLSVGAMAEEIQTDNNTMDVGATYVPGTVQIVGPDGTVQNATVYSVELDWTAIGNVKYDGGTAAYYWDAEALQYKTHSGASESAGWTTDEVSCTITVTNNSNSSVTATAEFAAKENIGATVSCTFTNNGVEIASAAPTQAELAAGTTQGSAKSDTITATVTANGALNSGVTSVGTITITISGK